MLRNGVSTVEYVHPSGNELWVYMVSDIGNDENDDPVNCPGTMYPPTGFWKFGYPVQPIPITMVPDGNDVHIEACGADVPGDFE